MYTRVELHLYCRRDEGQEAGCAPNTHTYKYWINFKNICPKFPISEPCELPANTVSWRLFGAALTAATLGNSLSFRPHRSSSPDKKASSTTRSDLVVQLLCDAVNTLGAMLGLIASWEHYYTAREVSITITGRKKITDTVGQCYVGFAGIGSLLYWFVNYRLQFPSIKFNTLFDVDQVFSQYYSRSFSQHP